MNPVQEDNQTRLVRLKDQLQYQQTRLERLSVAIAARPIVGDGESDPTATPTVEAAYSELGKVAQELGQLQTDLDGLEQSVSATTPAAATPTPGGDGRQLRLSGQMTVVQPGQPSDLYLPTDFEAIKANANRMKAEVDQLEQRLAQQQASAEGEAAPGYTALIQGEAAQQLASQPNAPHGWPVKGPITSPFGPRESLFGPKATTPATTPALGQGGNPITPTPVTTINLPDVLPTRIFTPATRPISTTLPPTATVTPGLTPAPTPTPTPGSTKPRLAIGTAISPTVTASPTPTATTPANPGPGFDSTGLVVGPGMEFHTGIDIGVPEGFEVHATADGVVEYAGDGRGGYGQVVYINHPGGFITIYGHNSRLLVKAGQTVKAGDTIALSGNTGYSTGPHVHYEIRYQSRLCDPAPFLPLN